MASDFDWMTSRLSRHPTSVLITPAASLTSWMGSCTPVTSVLRIGSLGFPHNSSGFQRSFFPLKVTVPFRRWPIFLSVGSSSIARGEINDLVRSASLQLQDDVLD